MSPHTHGAIYSYREGTHSWNQQTGLPVASLCEMGALFASVRASFHNRERDRDVSGCHCVGPAHSHPLGAGCVGGDALGGQWSLLWTEGSDSPGSFLQPLFLSPPPESRERCGSAVCTEALELDLNPGLLGRAAHAAGSGGVSECLCLCPFLTCRHPGLQPIEDGCHPVAPDGCVRAEPWWEHLMSEMFAEGSGSSSGEERTWGPKSGPRELQSLRGSPELCLQRATPPGHQATRPAANPILESPPHPAPFATPGLLAPTLLGPCFTWSGGPSEPSQ